MEGGKAKPVVQGDGEERRREGEGEIYGGEEGDWSKVCFLPREKETLMVNLTPKHINMTLR